MSWFRKKRWRETSKSDIPFSTIIRWALYDLALDNPNDIAIALGLNPVSQEGHDKENEDSLLRLEEIDALLPFADIISEIAAKIIASVQLREFNTLEEESMELEDIQIMQDFYKGVAFSALVMAFSSGIELDIIHPNIVGIGSTYKEYKDE